MESTRRELTPPDGLHGLLLDLKRAPERYMARAISAIQNLHDTVRWTKARMEQLEHLLDQHGIAHPHACFACQSRNVTSERAWGRERLTCGACGYRWRLGMNDEPGPGFWNRVAEARQEAAMEAVVDAEAENAPDA